MSDIRTTQEAYIHAFVGAQYGDLEFDVGKSVRWTQWFSDDVFILDINTGDPRYWIVNWTLTFPEATHSVTGINYFVDPAAFRKDQFARALKEPAILLEDNDWVLFVDASEGMSCDSRSLPDDVATEPFRSYVFREITRAIAAGRDNVVFPFFAFLRHAQIANVEYLTPALQGAPLGFATVQQSIGVPYYLPNLGMARLWKVSSLRAPGFDWTKIDQPQAVPDPAVKLQLVSYAYAHWNEQDIVPPATTVEAISATNDEGWRMRQLISKIRPLSGLPYTDPWKNPALDAGGDAGPWAGDQTGTPDVGTFNDGYLMTTDGYATGIFNADILRFQLSDEPWTIWMKLRLANVGANQLFVGQGVDTADEKGWAFGFIGGRYVMQVSLDGLAMTTIDLGSVASLGLTNNTTFYLGAVYSVDRDLDTYHVQAVKSLDGSVWTSVGPAATGPAFDPWRSIANMLVPPQTTPMQGYVYTIEALDSRDGGTVWRFDADDSAGAATWEDPSATQWTVTDPLGGSLVGIPGYLNTNTGWVSTPDTVDLSIGGNVRWTARVRRDAVPTPPGVTFRFLEQHMGSVTGHSWLERNDATGTMQIRADTKAAGTQLSRPYWSAAQTTQASPLNTDAWIGQEVIAIAGGGGQATWYGLVSSDGTTWTRLGTPQVESRPYIPQDPDGVTQYVGGNSANTKWPGRIYSMQMQAINRARLMLDAANSYATVPDAALLNLSGDFEIIARYTQPDWETLNIVSPNVSVLCVAFGNFQLTARVYYGARTMMLQWTGTGLGTAAQNGDLQWTYPTGWPAGQPVWVRFRFDADNGAGSHSMAFDYSTAQTEIEPTSWTTGPVTTKIGTVAIASRTGIAKQMGGGANQFLNGRLARFIVRNGIGATAPQLVFSGAAGNWLTIPHAATGQLPAGDIEIVARVSRPNWSGPAGVVIAKNGAYYFLVGANSVQLWSPGTFPISSALGFANGAIGWVRATRVAATGLTSFYSAPDSPTEPTVWTARGTSTGPTGAYPNPSAVVSLGAYNGSGNVLNGRILRVVVRDGIGGPVLTEVNESNATVGAATFPATTGGTVTVNQRQQPVFILPGTGGAGNYLSVPNSAPLQVTGDIEIVARIEFPTAAEWDGATRRALVNKWQGGATGRTFTLDKVTGRLEFGISTTGANSFATTSAALSTVGAITGAARWIKVTRTAATGATTFYVAADSPLEPTSWTTLGAGTTTDAGGNLFAETSPVWLGNFVTGGREWAGQLRRAIIRNGIAGTVVLDVNPDNATVGATSFVATAGGTVTVTQSAGITICQPDPAYSFPLIQGTVLDVNENDAGTLTDATHFVASSGQAVALTQAAIAQQQPDSVLWRFDANDYPVTGSPLVFTDPRGRTWTLSAAGAITPYVAVPALVMGWVTPATVPPPTAATAGVLVPLYDTVFRINLRDGVWYDKGQLGNVPLIWNDITQTWDPVVSPEDWVNNAFVQVP